MAHELGSVEKSIQEKRDRTFARGRSLERFRSANWEDLLNRLVKELLEDADDKLFSELRSNDFSLSVIASLLEKHCPEKDEFIEHVREVLYRDFDFPREVRGKATHGKFVQLIQKNNETLRSVASLCAI